VPAPLRERLTADAWARDLGIEYLEIRPGHCRAALTLRPFMVNYLGTPHGGVIFTLADAAFSTACNSHGEPNMALSVTISYLAPAPPGARLVAEARQRKQGRRVGLYDVTVATEDGLLVAVAHCVSHRVSGAAPGG
jgi:acyl-CoA thioesterase